MTEKKFEKLYANKEWRRLFNEQIAITAVTLKITIVQAEKRYSALLKSGIIDNGSSEDAEKQMEIDSFLLIEQP